MTGEERGVLLQSVAGEVREIRENQAYLKGHVEQMSARISEIPILVVTVEKQKQAIRLVAAALLIGAIVTAPSVAIHILSLFGL